MLRQNLLILLFTIISTVIWSQEYQVGERTFEYHDPSRQRPLKVESWYPTDDVDSLGKHATELPFMLEKTIRGATIIEGALPLIILSHGTGGNRFSLAWLAIELAKKGYMVAALDHYGNTFDNKIPKYFVRYWERPLDVSFILSELLEDEELFSQIDSQKIGMMGFSFGGYTSLAMAGIELNCEKLKDQAKTKIGKNQFHIPELGDLTPLIRSIDCDESPRILSDSRFKLFVSLAPALGLAATTEPLELKHPVLIIVGDSDNIAPMETNAILYHNLISSSKLITLKGGIGHYVFLNEAESSLRKVAKTYYQDKKGISRSDVHTEVSLQILEFLEQEF